MLPTGGLNLELIDREDGLGPVIDSWRSLAAARGNAFVTPEWYLAALRTLHAGSAPAAVVARDRAAAQVTYHSPSRCVSSEAPVESRAWTSGSRTWITGWRAKPITARRRRSGPSRWGSRRPASAALPCALACSASSPTTASASASRAHTWSTRLAPLGCDTYAYHPTGFPSRRTRRWTNGPIEASTRVKSCSR